MSTRVVVGCINWHLHAEGVPKAVSYVLRDGELMADYYHQTWAEAMKRANRIRYTLACNAGWYWCDPCQDWWSPDSFHAQANRLRSEGNNNA